MLHILVISFPSTPPRFNPTSCCIIFKIPVFPNPKITIFHQERMVNFLKENSVVCVQMYEASAHLWQLDEKAEGS